MRKEEFKIYFVDLTRLVYRSNGSWIYVDIVGKILATNYWDLLVNFPGEMRAVQEHELIEEAVKQNLGVDLSAHFITSALQTALDYVEWE